MTDADKASTGVSQRMAWGLVLLGAFFRILSYLYSANTGGDAGERVTLAAVWLQQPVLKLIFDVYPPGHIWLIGLWAQFVPDTIAAGRLLSLTLGIGSIILVWGIARRLYGAWAGLFSLAVFSFYSLQIAYSTTSSSEVSYLFFFLAGVLFFFRSLESGAGRLWRLAVAGACVSAAESIRFEAWILFGGLFLVLGVFLRAGSERQSWPSWVRSMLSFGATGGVWPVIMMSYCWRAFGDPMHLVTLNRTRVLSYLAANPVSRGYQLVLTPAVLLVSLSVIAMVGAVYGLAISFSSRLAAAFASLVLFFGLFQAYEIFSGGLLATARYTLTLGTLLAIVSGYGLQRICERFLPNRMAPAAGVVVGVLFLNLAGVLAASEIPNRLAEKFASVSPRLRFQKRIAVVGRYLRRELRADDAIVIDDYNTESGIVAYAAGLPLLPGRRAYLVSKKNALTVDEYIKTEHPRWLVYAEGGKLRRRFALAPGCGETQELEGIQFHCTFTSPIYRVFEMSYRGLAPTGQMNP